MRYFRKKSNLALSRVLVVCLWVFTSPVFASWHALPGYSFNDLLQVPENDPDRKVRVVGTSGLSWPDGRQLIATTIEHERLGKRWLFRCNDYFNEAMQHTGTICYELRGASDE